MNLIITIPMKKVICFGAVIGLTTLVVLLIVVIRFNTGIFESADTPNIVAVKRLLSAGAEIYFLTEGGVDLWSYKEDPYAHLPPLPLGIDRELPANIITEQSIRNITEISFCADALTEEDIQFLGTLPNRVSVRIVSGTLSDLLAEEMGKNLQNVKELSLVEMTLTTGAWRGLGKLKNVDRLWLLYTIIPDEFFEDGTEMSPVGLFINTVQISDAGLKKLIKTDKLEEIFWGQTNMSDNITSFFDECPKLENIRIEGSTIKCQFVAQMQNTDNLRILILHNTNIDDDILSSVARFPNLVELVIQGCNVTKSSIPLFEMLSKRLGEIVVRANPLHFDEYLFYYKDEKILDAEWRRKMQRKGIEID